MKKIKGILPAFAIAVFVLNAPSTVAQTQGDTVKTRKSTDPMVVHPGVPNDSMTVKPPKPNDDNAVLTDTGFLNKNIMDNLMEIQMSKIGRDKGSGPQIKEVATLMITDHTAMLLDLQKLVAKTNSNKPKPAVPVLPQANMKPSDNFNQVWASQMLTKHTAKIVELENFSAITQSNEIKAVIARAIPKIKRHMELLSKIPGAHVTDNPNTVVH